MNYRFITQVFARTFMHDNSFDFRDMEDLVTLRIRWKKQTSMFLSVFSIDENNQYLFQL